MSKIYDASTTAVVTAGSLTGVVNSDVVTVTGVATYDTSAVGTGKTITVAYTLAGAQAGNYIKPINYSTTTGIITAKPITVTADSGQTKIFGAADPTFTYSTSTSLLGSDVFTGVLGRAAGETVGTYAITQNTLAASANYAITFVPANFSITATIPGAPTIGTATAGNATATVAFTAPVSNGGSVITYYTVTSSSTGAVVTATSTASPITVTGLANGTAYTFTVTATNAVGTSASSSVSNSVVITSSPLTAIGVITGTTQVGSVLTAGALTPAEATVTYQWQSATISGGVYSNISGATASTYTLVTSDLGTFIKVVATATGNYTGTATSTATSIILGNITFTYNGGSVTYGTVYNSTTSKVWLDRNLGATRVALSSTDYLAYGDLFQWGRPADGHQLITWTNSTTGAGTNGTQSGQVATTTPGTNTFIIPNTDWSSIDSNGAIRSAYFGKTDGTGICPTGFRVPTEAELDTERASWSSQNSAGAFASLLKLTVVGYRNYNSGSLSNVGGYGYYWSSSVDGARSRFLYFGSGNATMSSYYREYGITARCLKD
jgi:hypothetical protein